MIVSCLSFAKALLEEFLPLPPGAKILDVNVENPELFPQNLEHAHIHQMDVKGAFTMKVGHRPITRHRFNIEMQQKLHKNFIERIVFYLCQIFSDPVNIGGSYDDITDTYSLIFVSQSLPKSSSTPGYVHPYRLTNMRNPKDWLFCLDLTVVELHKMKKEFHELMTMGEKLCFFTFRNHTINEEMAKAIFEQGGVMKEALKASIAISASDDLRNLVRIVEQFEKDKDKMAQDFMAAGLKEGLEEGLAKGMQKGATKTKTKIARSLLLEGMSHDKVSKVTSIDIKDIEQIAQDL